MRHTREETEGESMSCNLLILDGALLNIASKRRVVVSPSVESCYSNPQKLDLIAVSLGFASHPW